MKSEVKSALPISVSSFSKLRESGQIYVDKTELIYDLIRTQEKVFLARPRRFGKSLLISTFESLFKNGLKEFGGLAIEEKWGESTYTVLKFDFSTFKFTSESEFHEKFEKFLSLSLWKAGIDLPDFMPDKLTMFEAWLSRQPNASVVILVDEYDSPLTSCLENPQLFNTVRTRLSEFYALLKSNDAPVRFLFITGIAKFQKMSLFSEFNSLIDISLMPRYGALCGYTACELEAYFCDYLDRASETLGLDKAELLRLMALHYDGYCFDSAVANHVFAPWSVLNFLTTPEDGFQNYWYKTGGRPNLLLQYLKKHALKDPALYAKEQRLQLSVLEGLSDIEGIDDVALLTQTGYLTIKGIVDSEVLVGFPNFEVAASMGALYTEMQLAKRSLSDVLGGSLVETMTQGEPGELVAMFNRSIASLDYKDFPLISEAAVRGHLQALMNGARILPVPELHNYRGRSDLEADTGNRHWVFEIKFAETSEAAQVRLLEAREQILSRQYGRQHTPEKLIRMALVYARDARQFVVWERV